MPRYFFHTNHPDERGVQDDEGLQFRDIRHAKREAVIYAGQLLADTGEKFWDTADFELSVTDDRGLILFAMRVVGTQAPAIRREAQRDPSCAGMTRRKRHPHHFRGAGHVD